MTDLADRFDAEYNRFHNISKPRARQTLVLIRQLESRIRADGREVGQITSSDFFAFSADLVDAGYNVNTVRKKMNQLRAFFGWAYASEIITADQYLRLKGVKNPRGSSGKTTPKPYTQAEVKAFWAALDHAFPKLPRRGRGSQAIARYVQGKGPWGRVWRHAMRLQLDCMVRLALDLGLRAGEIFGLEVDDLHYDNEYIVVRGKADPNTGQVKVRKVPYTQEARQAIYTWLEFRAALLRPGHTRPWLSCYADARSNPMQKSRFDTLLQDTVDPHWAWHRFRHTCATFWLREGMELEKVRELLGHATIQQTLCYAEIAWGDLAKSMAKNEAAFREAVAA